MNALNSNSPFLATGGPQGFAVFYMTDDTIPADDLGIACPKDAELNRDADCSRNAGVYPIRISPKHIQSKAQGLLAAWVAFDSTLTDQVFAHETGHRLGRPHRTRTAVPVNYDWDGIRGMALGQFMQNPALKHLDELFVAEGIYALTTAEGFKQNRIVDDEVIDSGSSVPAGIAYGHRFEVGSPKPPVWPYRYSVTPMEPITQITLDSQDGTIMCARPMLIQTQDSQWMFAPNDLNGMCLLPKGCN